MLTEYAVKNGFTNTRVFIDDGYSGANYDRPGFQEMFELMTEGEIGVLITKDLSRLGRNYIETGMYIENIFPQLGIRYIAIADGVDTLYNMGEDNIIARINDEQFRMLSSDYNEERADITEKLPAIEKQMEALKDQSTGAERFVALARKYTNITELTPEILNTMIDKIIIGERENRHSKKNVKQKIRILFKGFGELDDLMCV